MELTLIVEHDSFVKFQGHFFVFPEENNSGKVWLVRNNCIFQRFHGVWENVPEKCWVVLCN